VAQGVRAWVQAPVAQKKECCPSKKWY
jgi:hypothetical protein